jgi:hypothetical protein
MCLNAKGIVVLVDSVFEVQRYFVTVPTYRRNVNVFLLVCLIFVSVAKQSIQGIFYIRAVENCLLKAMQTLTSGNGTRISRIQGYTRRHRLLRIQDRSRYCCLV